MQPSLLTYILLEHLPHVGISAPCTHLAQNHECYDLFSTSLNTTTINNEVVHRGTHHDTQTHKYRFYFENGWFFCYLGVTLALNFVYFCFSGLREVRPWCAPGGIRTSPGRDGNWLMGSFGISLKFDQKNCRKHLVRFGALSWLGSVCNKICLIFFGEDPQTTSEMAQPRPSQHQMSPQHQGLPMKISFF